VYSSKIVDERLAVTQTECGFRLEYHSPAEIDAFQAQLERKYADEYARARAASAGTDDPDKTFQIHLTRALCDPDNPRLTREEVRFIQNERYLIQCDSAYFLTRYYMILNRENNLQRFTLQPGQRVLFSVIAELEDLRISIEIILAKARQLGMTTLSAGLILLKTMISVGVSGIVASADRGKTEEMAQKFFFAYSKLPWWIRPMTSKRVQSASGQIAFAGLDSKIAFQHGKQTNPIAMGSTPISYHLSEVSSYPNAEELIDVGLFKCVHPSTRVLGILESTCKGDTGWWSDTYWYSKKEWSAGSSRLLAMFLPYYMGTDMYPNETWLRAQRQKNGTDDGCPVDWRPCDETRRMMAESAMYIQSSPVLDKILRNGGGQWELPRQQALYWEVNFLEHRAKGRERDWYQEMPHTDKAAFQGSYDNVFGKETIAEAWTGRTSQYEVYGIVGQSIEDRHEPSEDDIDHRGVIVPVRYTSRRDEEYRWELWPLNFKEPFASLDQIRHDMTEHMGKLFVWHPPEPGYDYSIGVDTSTGQGMDGTVIAVCRRARDSQEQDVQAAEWRDNRVGHVEAWAWVMAIAAYYSRYMGQHGISHREPYMAIEQIAAVGDVCQTQMQLCGYRRFHHPTRYDGNLKSMNQTSSNKLGWYTSGWSRPILTGNFVTFIQNGWYKIHSPYTLWEMDHWEVHYTATKEKFEHGTASTDDGIFANALASFCPNDQKAIAERSKNQFRGEPKGIHPKLDVDTIVTGRTFKLPAIVSNRKDLRGETTKAIAARYRVRGGELGLY